MCLRSRGVAPSSIVVNVIDVRLSCCMFTEYMRKFLPIICYVLLLLHSSELLDLKCDAKTPSTDPLEVRALNAVFSRWDVRDNRLWNISGEPCSGSAVNDTQFEDQENDPSIKCNCSYNNGLTCHITQLRVQKLDKRGMIPNELFSLTYLFVLKLDKNYFSGVIPPAISNLSALQVLTISHNAFYGAIPKELGSLKEMKLLAISSNNFSGFIPHELGNLVDLELLYMDSCGAGGEFPSTFENLVNLKVMWAIDSPFKGKIPEYIGNWSNLVDLRIQGTSFEGPIPPSFSKLSILKILRISDLYAGVSSLDFLKDMNNLTDLVLRNALVSGTIPYFLGNFQSLQKLDLSFNTLTGEIPSSLFTLRSLVYLFLGNNSLSGSLPLLKSDQLRTIDLSYNRLSGGFPAWVSQNIQLNIVANAFTFSGANESLYPGLHCLQGNFNCNRNTEIYTTFSIKCGGPEFTTADGIIFESENSLFNPASYYVNTGANWAVSNVGLFADMSYASYLQKAQTEITGTDSPELFNTSRISPGSLRYYGLGLMNGPYIVNLLFAELAFDGRSRKTWGSLGRRVFDIYIQGSLRQKDFDISAEAGGVNRAIQKNFSCNVSKNYLEIHLFWAGKGTCCIPGDGYYGPSISALSVMSEFHVPAHVIGGKGSKRSFVVVIAVAVGTASFITGLGGIFWKLRMSHSGDEQELGHIEHKPNMFTYTELKSATRDFNIVNKLGEGGSGSVYKGILCNGRVVAVKLLSLACSHGKSQFVAEIATISVVQHRNLVTLYGCCTEGDKRLIVYEYLENRSLAEVLFGQFDFLLDWSTRFSISLGTARGLAYLHEDSRPRIVHRDVKASNILLDTEFSPKISDFGLAKLYHDKNTHISTRVAGTIGYLAPEYAMRGHLTEKVDVFGFGVVVLEIISGRPNFDDSLGENQKYLLDWAWNLHEKNNHVELLDWRLSEYDEEEVVGLMKVGLLCTQSSPTIRPSMSRVVAMLSGDAEIGVPTARPSYLSDWDFRDTTSGFSISTASTS